MGFDTWDGQTDIFDYLSVEGNGVDERDYKPIVERIIAEARCTYEDVEVE